MVEDREFVEDGFGQSDGQPVRYGGERHVDVPAHHVRLRALGVAQELRIADPVVDLFIQHLIRAAEAAPGGGQRP